jgi:hypothetical protein
MARFRENARFHQKTHVFIRKRTISSENARFHQKTHDFIRKRTISSENAPHIFNSAVITHIVRAIEA